MKKLIVNLQVHTASSGFTIIELMIIVAASVIILTMAIPSYSTYSIRSKIGKSLSTAASAKSSIVFACQENPALTYVTNQTVHYNYKASEFIFNIKLGGDCDTPTITLTTQATGAEPDPVLTITGDSTGDAWAMKWVCVSNSLSIHLPKACRS